MNGKNTSSHPVWLACLAAIFGTLISLLIGYLLLSNPYSLNDAHLWIILGQGILLAMLVGLAIGLAQMTRQRQKSLEKMNESFQKEITERIHAQETQQKLEKAFLQGQKLQAIGTLAGGIAHDFNNILYAIIGYTEMAREDVAPNSLVYENLGKVLSGCKRGQELISQILTFSRRHHQDFTPIPLKETIESILGLLRPTIPASVNLSLRPILINSVILGNQTQLHQVIVNIINNAVDAMDGEGNIIIELSQVTPQDKILKQFPRLSHGNYCKINIIDTGHGMDQSTIERIFEPFYTTKEVGKGTGLGLATAHSIIKEHQGEIIVESQLGRGSTFTLLLPEQETPESPHGKNITR